MSVEEGEDRAKAEGIMFIETSAKGGYNIKVVPCDTGRFSCFLKMISACYLLAVLYYKPALGLQGIGMGRWLSKPPSVLS